MNHKCIMCYEAIQDAEIAHEACIQKFFGTSFFPNIEFDQSKLNELAVQQLNLKLALPGVQKKLSTILIKEKQSNIIRLTVMDALSGLYIFKPQTEQYAFMPEIEDLTMHLAQLCKFQVAEHSLVPFDSGYAYMTKRFDRVNSQKIPIEDMCQLSRKMSVDKYRSSMEQIGKAILFYTTYPGEELTKFYEITLFNFIVGNVDMHLKNFSLITEPGNIRLSPCYDLLSTKLLIPDSVDPDETALPINGKQSNLKNKDFILFGKTLGLDSSHCVKAIHEMSKLAPLFYSKIQKSFLPNNLQEKFILQISKRISQIN